MNAGRRTSHSSDANPGALSAPNLSMNFELILNGRSVRVEGVSPTTTLLEFLRARGLTGSKRGCDEGDCGACTVALVDRDASGRPCYRAINSCIALLPMFAGREIVTVEGIADGGRALHPVQQAMVDHYGSQCGYCTPGFVVSLFEAYYRGDCREPVADQRPALRQPLPLHRLPADSRRRARGAGGSGAAAPGRTVSRSGFAAPVAPPGALDYARGGRELLPAGLAGGALRAPAGPSRGAGSSPGRRRSASN